MSLLWRLKEIKEWMKGLNGLKLDEGIVIEIIEKFWEKIVIEKIMVGDLEKLMCLVVEKIGMEYKGGDERKEVIIGDRVEMKRERLNKKLDISERNENWKIWRIIKRIGEIEKKLLENEWKCVGEGGEGVEERIKIVDRIGEVRRWEKDGEGVVEKIVVKREEIRSKRKEEMIDIKEKGGMREGGKIEVVEDEGELILKRIERGMEKKDREVESGRELEKGIGVDEELRNMLMKGVDVESERSKVVDVRKIEGKEIGDKEMGIMKEVIKIGNEIGEVMKEEGLKKLRKKGFWILLKKEELGLGFLEKRKGEWNEDIEIRKKVLRLREKILIGDKVEEKKRGEKEERIVFKGWVIKREEGGGVKRKKGRDKIVIEERENENEREEEENNGKIGGGEKEDWEMELLRNKVERIGLGKELMKMDVVGKKIGIKVGEEVNEGEIGRKLLNVNGRNGWRKRGENGIRRKEFMVFNWENLSWKGNIREMNVWIGGKMNGLWWKCII